MEVEDGPLRQVLLLPSNLEHLHLILKEWLKGSSLQYFFPPGIQAGHWGGPYAFVCFSLLGSTRCHGVFPRQLPAAPTICPTGTLFVKQMEFPSKMYCLLCVLVLKYGGPGKEGGTKLLYEKWDAVQGRVERGRWEIFITSKVNAKVRPPSKSV